MTINSRPLNSDVPSRNYQTRYIYLW